jgi:alpha-amylase
MNPLFTIPSWALKTNIYEINLRQYTAEGTCTAFAKELPRLKDMGIETLWFMPIYPIGKKNRKGTLGSYYSIQNYTALNGDYGSSRDFKLLIEDAHQLGFKIMLDWVANHTAWDHEWTISHPEFYSKDDSGNFRPPFPDWEDVIQLDFNNRELWKAMIDTMQFWVREFDIDGYRCDMAHLVPLNFWKEARQSIDYVKPLFWLGETEDPTYHEVFDASYTWEMLHKMEALWRGETNVQGLKKVLDTYRDNFPSHACRVFFTSNHDENSHSGSEYERMGEAAKAFAVFCATWKGIPLIYSGQELPNTKRLKFFDKDNIEWSGKYELHDFYQKLLSLKATNNALRADAEAIFINAGIDNNIFSYLRKYGNHEVWVLLNLSHNDAIIKIPGNVEGRFKDIFLNKIIDLNNIEELHLDKWGYKVFEKKDL